MLPSWLISLLLYEGAWLGAALLRDQSTALLLLASAAHLYWLRHFLRDFIVFGLALVLGLLTEFSWQALSLVEYNSSLPIPPWIVLLWGLLGMTFHYCLAWLLALKTAYQALIGALLAPLAYFAAESLGALTLTQPPLTSALLLALSWALMFPLLARAAHLAQYHVTRIEQWLQRHEPRAPSPHHPKDDAPPKRDASS